MPEIQKIEPLVTLRKSRTAAYARVSSDKDAQLNSLSAQVSYYTELIQRRPEWEYAGTYVDEAFSGTKAARPGFQRLMEDCRAGKIDIVLTKSISRFARNTLTTLEAVRELKALGVEVWFERENIRTMSGDGELMLSILASFAQEESKSVSDNCKWRIRDKFKQGKPTGITMYGYKMVDSQLIVIPEEAEVVRMIFADYLGGMGKNAIMKKLNAMGVPSKHGGKWNESVINDILRCEKVCGELLLQKTHIEDHLTKKQLPNRGELPMYHVEGNHEAIIDKETFDAAQEELARRAARHKSKPKNRSRFTGKITCGLCGKHYRRKIASPGSQYEKPVWICATYNQHGKAACPASLQIPEDILTATVDEGFSSIFVPEPNVLVVTMPDGSTTERRWQHRSRRESWTDEMRQQAREHAKKGRKKP
jgi:DNA invertase Pin-like site-specific DNA recombinase